MGFRVIITRDFDAMSETAAEIVVGELAERTGGGGVFKLGLATGNTPTGLYKLLAKAANRGEFDASRVVSFNLDEYVGLPGDNPQERALHPESYTFFMVRELFGLLRNRFRKTCLPAGTLIDQGELDAALAGCPDDWEERGEDKGRAIVIGKDAASPCLSRIRAEVLDPYAAAIREAGGVDLHVIGVGGRGHVGFHESGIPFDEEDMLLVRLDENTIENAIADGHFADRGSSPRFAVSMSAPLVYRAKKVLMVANGPRKSEPVAASLLLESDPAVPISYAWQAVGEGREVIYVLDRAAAAGVLERADEIRRRGVEIEDLSSRGAKVPLAEITFCRDPDSCLLE